MSGTKNVVLDVVKDEVFDVDNDVLDIDDDVLGVVGDDDLEVEDVLRGSRPRGRRPRC